MKIQLALDRLTRGECIRLIDQTSASIDWVEIGTGVIKEYGMDIIRDIKTRYPDKVVVADMKTCDAGKYEAEQAFRAGADVTTVMAFAHDQTIRDVLQVARSFGKEAMIDLLQVSDHKRVEEIHQLGADFYCVHIGKDSQATGETASSAQLSLVRELPAVRVAIAGGINEYSAPGLSGQGIDVVIVGSAITKSENPRIAAQRLKELL